MLTELHQGIYGVPNTEDNGLIGDVKNLVEVVKKQNSRISVNEQKIGKVWGVLIGSGVISGAALGFGIRTLF